MNETVQFRLRKNGVSWRELDGQIVVLDLESSKYVTVNGAGAVIWEHLVPGASVDDLVNVLVECFDIDQSTARADTESFLEDLRQRNLLR
jgi:hypothetical protein